MFKAPMVTLFGCALLPCGPAQSGQYPTPPLMLASEYREQLNLKDYLVSEKLDGVRAYWDGQQLLTRSGNKIQAPDWFTQGFPQIPMDGELWLGRGQFEPTSALVRASKPTAPLWQEIQFMVFDLPSIKAPFTMRYQQLQALLEKTSTPQLKLVQQFSVQSLEALEVKLHSISAQGGEGLMLRLRQGLYEPKRSQQLLKLKIWQDEEALVIAHEPGQGEFSGVLGALWVRDNKGRAFKIGTGFTLAQRQTPPPIGATVTYRYQGRTSRGIPRFASFLRLHSKE